MYSSLLFSHSMLRWLVLGGLLYSIWIAYTGYRSNRSFTRSDNAVRHWTATLAHIQLTIGFVLYFISPVVDYFLHHTKEAIGHTELTFFGIIHSSLMLIAVIVLTIGSALAKRRTVDREKFKTMLLWFSIALLLIFIAIPWPFSPLAARPFFRTI
jgi:hypothetical protein